MKTGKYHCSYDLDIVNSCLHCIKNGNIKKIKIGPPPQCSPLYRIPEQISIRMLFHEASALSCIRL